MKMVEQASVRWQKRVGLGLEEVSHSIGTCRFGSSTEILKTRELDCLFKITAINFQDVELVGNTSELSL